MLELANTFTQPLHGHHINRLQEKMQSLTYHNNEKCKFTQGLIRGLTPFLQNLQPRNDSMLERTGSYLDHITIAPIQYLLSKEASAARKFVDITFVPLIVGAARIICLALICIEYLPVAIVEVGIVLPYERKFTAKTKESIQNVVSIPLDLIFEVLRMVPIAGHFLAHGALALSAAVYNIFDKEDEK